MFRLSHLTGGCRIALQVLTILLFALATASGQYILSYQKDGTANNNQLGFSVALVGDLNNDGQSDFAVGAPYADPGGRTDAGSVFIYSGTTGALLYQKDGVTAGDRLGWSVANIGDLNFDQKPDFIVGAPLADPSGKVDAGVAYVFSGANGNQLCFIDGISPGAKMGWSVAGIGDLNNDFRSDFIVGAPFDSVFGVINRGVYIVVSGALDGNTFAIEYGLFAGDLLGWSVGGAGDVNGDGRSDYIVGAPGAEDPPYGRTDEGYIIVRSGLNNSLIYKKYGLHAYDSLGYSVGIVGDANTDGKADFIGGAPTADPGGLGNAGSAYVYSGVNGNVLYQKNGAAAGYRFGQSVGRAGDVNSDGKTDFIVGAPLATAGGFSFAGSAYVYSGGNGGLLFQRDGGTFNDQLGYSVGGAGDINASGQSDFIIGAPLANPGGLGNAGSAFVYGDDISNTLPLVLLYQKDGTTVNSTLGFSVAGVGDVNGDNYADFIIGAPYAQNTPNGVISSAYVYSGATGALVYQKDGMALSDAFGRAVSGIGDVNGDGKAEFIIAAPRSSPGGLEVAGSAYVYNGATSFLLYQKNGAAAYDMLGEITGVAGAGDVSGDGRPDYIVGSWGANPGGRWDAGSAFVYSGATDNLLYQNDGATNGDRLGISVAGAGDVNGDGKADFIIGAHGVDIGGLPNVGSVYVYSGATGVLLYQKNGVTTDDNFGFSVGGAGDVNGDGKADFIVGTPFANIDGFYRAGAGPGSAYVYSGADGSLLFKKNGIAYGDNFGHSVAGVGDLNGDGKQEFMVGAYGSGIGGINRAGAMFVFSGATGGLLFRKSGSDTTDNLGYSVREANDVNGDGRSDIIVGAPGADRNGISNAGAAYVYGFPCPYAKGDMNGDGSLTSADVVLMQNCVYYGTGDCRLCFTDVNCDGQLSSADVVLEINAVYNGTPFPC